MSDKNIKLLVTDSTVSLILIIIMLRHFTIAGLVSVVLGGLMLFLGTFLDTEKAPLGVANKFSFIMFSFVLTACGICLPDIIKNDRKIGTGAGEFAIALLFFALFVVVAVVASKASNYAVIRVFRYLEVVMLAMGVNAFVGLPDIYCLIYVAVATFFCLCDIFSAKFMKARVYGYNILSNKDKGFWMAMALCAVFIFYAIYSSIYVNHFVGSAHGLKKSFVMMASGFKVPLFCLMMLALSVVYHAIDRKLESSSESDTYLATSLFGFAIVFRVFSTKINAQTLVLFLATLAVWVGFGLNYASKTQKDLSETYKVKRMFKADAVSLAITLLSIFSINFVYKGYLFPYITLVFVVMMVIAGIKMINGFWIADAVKWQLVIVAIFIFALSLSIAKKTTDCIDMLVFTSLIMSLLTWALSIRKGNWDNTSMVVPKVLNCVITAVICLVAVV